MKPNFDPTPAPRITGQLQPAGGKAVALNDALRQQAQASAGIASIPSPSVPTQKEIGPQTLNFQTITIPAGKAYPVLIKGDFVYIEGFTFLTDRPGVSDTVGFRTDTMQSPVLLTESYREIQFPQPYNYIEFVNNNTTNYPVTVSFWAGFGRVRRDRNAKKSFSYFSTTIFGAIPTIVAANYYICNGPLVFSYATSPYVQSAKIITATCSKTSNVAGSTTWNVSLWLFSRDPSLLGANLNYNQPFNYDIYTFVGYQAAGVLGKIDFAPPVTGTAPSLSASVFVSNLNIPIFSDVGIPQLNRTNFPIYGVLVSNAAYADPMYDVWEVSLAIEYS